MIDTAFDCFIRSCQRPDHGDYLNEAAVQVIITVMQIPIVVAWATNFPNRGNPIPASFLSELYRNESTEIPQCHRYSPKAGKSASDRIGKLGGTRVRG
jgi:hypothetical protein